MSRLDDLYRLHRLLDGRRTAISRQTLIEKLEISRSKLTRLIADLSERRSEEEGDFAGMFVMAYNVWKTVAGQQAVNAPIPAVAAAHA